MSHLEAFNVRFKELLAEKDLNLYRFEQQFKVAHSTAHAWYCGKSFPQVEYLYSLADFFDCTIDYLLAKEN